MKKTILTALVTMTLVGFALAGTVKPANSQLAFVENKGQITNQYHGQRAGIQFRMHATEGLDVFIGAARLEYQYSKPQNSQQLMTPKDRINGNITFDMYRMDVELVDANKNAVVMAEERQDEYERYLIAGNPGYNEKVYGYCKITYKDIYPNIDWVLYTRGNSMKHEFVVRHGGNAAQIKLKYGGATTLGINADGSLTATTPMGEIAENAPVSFHNGVQIKSAYTLDNNVLGFETGTYNEDIVIDPMLDWSTYYGGSGYEFGYATTADALGNIYMTGCTASSSSIATTGAYQVTYGGGSYDVLLTKFDTGGHRLWATYYGGSGDDQGLSIAADHWGCIYVSGKTGSSSGIATSGAYHTYLSSGASDAFLARFDATGAIKWGTYHSGVYSGSDNEYAYGVAADPFGKVYIMETAKELPYETDFIAIVAKFDSSGSHTWSKIPIARVYGSDKTYGNAITIDANGDLYIAGYTNVGSGMATSGAYQTSPAGPFDNFIVKLDSGGNKLWATYYGNSESEVGKDIAVDNYGSVYLGSYCLPVGTSTFRGTVTKFNSSCSARLWEVVKYNGEVEAIDLDNSGNVYVVSLGGLSGYGTAVNVYNPSGVGIWGTTFGTTMYEKAYAITAGAVGDFFIAGVAQGTTNVATTGAYQTSLNGTCDAFLARYKQCNLPVAGTITGSSDVCVSRSITLTNAVAGGNWTTGASYIASVSASGVVTGVSTGTTDITYTVTDPCGSANTIHTMTVVPTSVCIAQVADVSGKLGSMSVSPNPNTGSFTLELISDRQEQAQITIVDILGSRLKEFTVETNKANDIRLGIASGIYFISATTSYGKTVQKIVIE